MSRRDRRRGVGRPVRLAASLGMAVSLGLLAAPMVQAAPGYLKKVSVKDLLGSWRITRRGPKDRTYSINHYYFLFRKKRGRLQLRIGAAAALWTYHFSAGQPKRVKSLHTAADYARCKLSKGILSVHMKRTCGKAGYRSRAGCRRMKRIDKYTLGIWRNDVFHFDLLILDHKRPISRQKWFYRVPERPKKTKAKEAKLIGNWWIKPGGLFTTSSLRLFYWLGKYRYRTVVDTKVGGSYSGLTITVGTYEIKKKKIFFTQESAYFCKGIFQYPVFTDEAFVPPDLAVCRGGRKATRFSTPYKTTARRGKKSHLWVTFRGRRLKLFGVPN